MSSLFDVSGKVALVTGGSRGIGGMIAKGLVDNGAKVYVTARNASACEAIATELGGSKKCVAIPADISKVAEIQRVVETIEAQEQKLDILINNAGTVWGAPIEKFPEDGFDKVISLNLKAVFFATQKCLPLLRRAGTADNPARIISIGSVEGLHVPSTDTFSYSATKSAVHHLTRHIAARVAKDHITVNAIAPGPFVTKMTEKMENFDEIVAESVPLQRPGRADDIVGTILFLTSRAGAYVTAVTLPLDGGWTGCL